MVDIFDEVSDDLRQERALALAKRYGALLVLACVLVLLGVAGQQYYEHRQQARNEQAAGAFLALTSPIDGAANVPDAEAKDTAKKLEAFAAGAPEGYRTLAELRAAALYAEAGVPAQAAATWNRLADDSAADPLLRDLANLLWVQHEMGIAPDDALLARLKPLAATSNPYHGLAQETQALILIRQGKTDQAKALFAQLAADPSSPEGVRNRAQGLLAKLNG